MKQSAFLSSAAILLLMLFSCNSGSDDKSSDATKDSAATVTTPAPPPLPAKPVITLLIKHKVVNFDKWFVSYEAHDSVRMSYGLHNFVVGRGTKDSNTVVVALRVDDTAKAKEFVAAPALKERMQKAGVTGPTAFMYIINRWHDSTTDATTDRIIINHHVKDYDAWKKVFDSDKQARMDAGMTDRAVSQSIDDPNFVSVVFVINDTKKATGFMNSKDLKDKMTEAGVVGPPDIFMYHVVKQYQ